MKYIGKIAMAIQNISEGDLNTRSRSWETMNSLQWHPI